jgi:hypothetical protein
MAVQAMWVHGNSAQIELTPLGRGSGEDIGQSGVITTLGGGPVDPKRQWTAIVGYRTGAGVEYRCQDNSDYWFHFPIPTPVIDDGVRARLRRVMVLFTARTAVTLSSVHVWDGPNRVFTVDGLAIGGTNTALVDGANSFALPDREVRWGIGVSVKFHFADPSNVVLHGAGIDFES